MSSTEDPNQTTYWCRASDVGNWENFGVTTGVLVVVVFAFIVTVVRLVRLIRLKASWDVIIVHCFLLLSETTFILEYILSIANYLLILDLDGRGVTYQDYPLYVTSTLPRLIFATDILIGPILLTILLIVPYYWVKNIMYFMDRVAELNPSPWISVFNKAVLAYVIVSRLGYLGMEGIVFLEAEPAFTVYKYLRLFIALESFLATFVVWFGGHILIKNFVKIAIVEERDKNLMQLQFRSLMGVCICRVVFNILVMVIGSKGWTVFNLFKRDYRNECLQNSTIGQYPLSGMLSCFIVPIGVIIWLYMRADEEKQRATSTSLIGSSTVTGSNKESFLD